MDRDRYYFWQIKAPPFYLLLLALAMLLDGLRSTYELIVFGLLIAGAIHGFYFAARYKRNRDRKLKN